MNRTIFILIVSSAALIAGCFSSTPPEDPDKTSARAANGRGPDGSDLCRANGWYEDGVCDDFCPEIDPECVVSCPNPDPSRRVRYLFDDPAACAAADIACEPDETPFENECGCGCIGPASPPCPDPDDPAVRYASADPGLCTMIDLDCTATETAFSNACGCGCIGTPTSCPDPSDPAVTYASMSPATCAMIDLACAPTDRIFSDECGCGCISTTSTCPDPDDPNVHYVGESPEICALIDFACEEEQSFFDGPCGCGCIDVGPLSPCNGLSEFACLSDASCTPGYSGVCDCTCPGPTGYEGGGCDGCGRGCFIYQACVAEPSCPDEAQPYIRYLHRDDASCEALSEPRQFHCGDEEGFFMTPGCGCGCIDSAPL